MRSQKIEIYKQLKKLTNNKLTFLRLGVEN